MKRFLSILKTTLLISLLLLSGQIPVGERTVGAHLVHNIYKAIVWVGDSLREADWFAKMSDTPAEKEQARMKAGRVAIAPRELSAPVEVTRPSESEKISPSDRDSLLKLLDE